MFASHDALESLGSDVFHMTLDGFNELYVINGRDVNDNIVFECSTDPPAIRFQSRRRFGLDDVPVGFDLGRRTEVNRPLGGQLV
jgi:hypothetical protein